MLAGIDLGGTQVRVALARSDGQFIASVKTRTHTLPTPQAMVDWAAAEIDRHRGREKVRSITIAAPGPIDLKRGVLVNPPNLPWQNVPLVALMSRATGAKVNLANDADMAGLGEFHHGAGRGTRNMVYITWSTGVGGGLIIDGKLHRGGHGTAGEIGHMIVDPNGPLDNCGQRGCLEAFVSGTALARSTRGSGSSTSSDRALQRGGSRRSASADCGRTGRALYGTSLDQPDQRHRSRDLRDRGRRFAVLGFDSADHARDAALVAVHQARPPAPPAPCPTG